MGKVVERDTETIIDFQLKNLNWDDDPKSIKRNVYKQQAKTQEQNQKLGNYRPDYVLYKSDSTEPLIIIEVKRPGKDIESALLQGKRYAELIGAPIVFATDGVFTRTLYTNDDKPLSINGEEIEELIREVIALKFIEQDTNEIITLNRKVVQSRSELINIFKQANDYLRAEGLTAGVERFSEFSNILFLKLISELEEIKDELNDSFDKSSIEREYRWNYFKNMKGKVLLDYVNDIVLKKFSEKYDDSTIFSQLTIKNPQTLERIIEKLDSLQLTDINADIKGDAFEYFLKSYNSGNKDLGEYFTPRHIIKAMVKLINPQFGETIYDPFCGTGGMLTECFKHLRASIPQNEDALKFLREKTIYGNEITNTAKITKMNMILMGDGHSNIQRKDSLKNPVDKKFDIVITNIPFSQTTEYGHLYDVPTNQGNSICVQHCLRALKDTENARAIIIVPEGFLVDDKYKNVRKYLLEKYSLHSIVSLPQGTFKPYTEVKTSILVFKNRKSKSKDIWYYTIKDDGYTLNTKRKKKNGTNDFDILLAERELETQNLKFLTTLGFKMLKFDDIRKKNYKLGVSGYDIEKYSSNYEIIKLSELISEYKTTNANNEFPVWSVTNNLGFIASDERFNEQVASDNTENYKVVERNNFAYNPSRINVGSIALNDSYNIGCVSPMYVVFSINEEKILPKYLKYVFDTIPMKNIIKEMASGSVRQTLNYKQLTSIAIPVPNINKQKEIINELEVYDSIIESSEKIINSYKPYIEIKECWKIEKLSTIADVVAGQSPEGKFYNETGEGMPFYQGKKEFTDIYLGKPQKWTTDVTKTAQEGDIVMSVRAPVGPVNLVTEPICIGRGLYAIRANNKVKSEYLFLYLKMNEDSIQGTSGSVFDNLSKDALCNLEIPLPAIEEQKEIINRYNIEKEYIENQKALKELFAFKKSELLNLIWRI